MATRDWSNLKVSAASRKFIEEMGFKRMTPVQAIAIPLLLNHRDVAVEACTGSGKTLSFLIPAVELLLREETSATASFNVGAAVLAPTRELATQIYEVLGKFLEAAGRESDLARDRLRKQLFVGGTDAKAAVEAIARTDDRGKLQIVVATPGRLRALMDIAGRERLSLRSLEVMVLDEADRLLQLGFASDIDAILSAAPKQRRTGLFSATLTSELQRLMKTGMRNPVHVCVRRKAAQEPAKPAEPAAADAEAPAATPADAADAAGGKKGKKAKAKAEAEAKAKAEADAKAKADKEAKAKEEAKPSSGHELPTKLQNHFVTLPADEKLGFLVDFLKRPDVRNGKTIIFFLTCACVDHFAALLSGVVDAPNASKKGQKKAPQTRRIEKLHGQMDQKARSKSYEKFANSPLGDGCVLLATDLAARGIDVEAVGWVVQFDAPCDPTAFVHRIGRSARAGMSGQSLLMVMPSEDAYVPYLKNRGISMEEWQTGDDAAAAKKSRDTHREAAKRLVETDRVIMLKSSKAFVSYMRAYQEHQLPYLFPAKSLDLGGLATCFCLLRLPRMKEILGKKIKGFVQSEVDPSTVPFKIKAQEAVRQENLKRKREEWEKSHEEGAQQANEKKAKEIKEIEEEQKKTRTRTQKRKAKRNTEAEERRLLAEEERLAKKLRTGKITAKQFSKEVKKVAKKVKDGSDEDSDDTDVDENAQDDSSDGEDTRYLKKRKRRGKARH